MDTQDRIAQWISASDFGSEGRGFDSHCGRHFFCLFLFLFFVLSCLLFFPPTRKPKHVRAASKWTGSPAPRAAPAA